MYLSAYCNKVIKYVIVSLMTDKKPKTQTPSEKRQSDEQWARLPWHMGEVTWRVAVPILLLSIGGVKLDERLNMRPLFSITGLLVSLIFASLLIYRYIRDNFPDSFGGK